MIHLVNILSAFAVFFAAHSALAKLTKTTPDLTVSVSNFDKSFVYLKDKKGNRYKYPRNKFMAKDFKVHQTFSVHQKTLQEYKIKNFKKKKPSSKRN